MMAMLRTNICYVSIRAAANFEEMAAGINKRRVIQHTVFQELCKVNIFIKNGCFSFLQSPNITDFTF